MNDLPTGWQWSTLGEISEKPQYGWTTKAVREGGSIKLLRTTDITTGDLGWKGVPFCKEVPDNLEKYLVKPGDLLISRAGSVGFSYLVSHTEPAVFASYLIRFRIKEGVSKRYVAYFLKSPAYWKAIGASKAGIAIPNVNAKKLAQVRIPIAPREQQEETVAEIEKQFSRLDEAVANLKRVKANLKRYKAAVLKAAVEGKLTEEWRKAHPGIEPASKLLDRILAERRARWEEAELAKMEAKGKAPKNDKWKAKYKEPTGPDSADLPELPEGWVWASLGQLTWDSSYGTSVKCSYENDGPPVLRIPNVDKAKIDLTDIKCAPNDLVVDGKDALAPGDMLVIRTNGSKPLIGRAAIVTEKFPQPITYASYLIRFRILSDDTLSAWVLSYWQSLRSRRWIESKAATSAGQHNISMTVLASSPIPLPPSSEQCRIVTEVERSLSLIDETEAQVQTNLQRAERLRQSILNEAYFGEMQRTQ